MRKIGLGIVGCGFICGIYLQNLHSLFDSLELLGVCNAAPEKAEAVAKAYPVQCFPDLPALLRDERIELILNLTRPAEHFSVSLAALQSGKHVYSEKPLAASVPEGRRLMAEAEKRALLIGRGLPSLRARLKAVHGPVRGFRSVWTPTSAALCAFAPV